MKGTKIKVPMQEELEMKFAVVEDPNGLEVRLIEAKSPHNFSQTEGKKPQV
jgi:hypothetical protein